MNNRTDSQRPLLAVDPSVWGFGFVLLDAHGDLHDWGVRFARRDKNAACLRGVRELMERYGPATLIVEDARHPTSLRRTRIRKLFQELRRLAALMHVTFASVPWHRVREVCGISPRASKYEIARAVAEFFPPIAHRLPPPRKCYLPEWPQMGLFGAGALAITWLEDRARGNRAA